MHFSLVCVAERREGHDSQDEPATCQFHQPQPTTLGRGPALLQSPRGSPGLQGDEENGNALLCGHSFIFSLIQHYVSLLKVFTAPRAFSKWGWKIQL